MVSGPVVFGHCSGTSDCDEKIARVGRVVAEKARDQDRGPRCFQY
jgi:hypothetical protein